VIDRSVEARFNEEDGITSDELGRRVEFVREHAAMTLDIPRSDEPEDEHAGQRAEAVLGATEKALRLDAGGLERLLRVGIELDGGSLEAVGDDSFRLARIPPTWQSTVDMSLRADGGRGAGALPRIVFSSETLAVDVGGGRKVYRERADKRLLRLAHPLMRRAGATLRRRLWEDAHDLTRFTVASGAVDEPLIVVPCLLTLVNELREPLHAELLELALTGGGEKTAAPSAAIKPLDRDVLERWQTWIEDRWDELEPVLEEVRATTEQEMLARVEKLLPDLLRDERAHQQELFAARLRELDDERGQQGRARLERDIARLEEQMLQLTFDPLLRQEQEDELRRLRAQLSGEEYRHYEDRRERLRARIEAERRTLLDDILPRRYALVRCTLTPAALALIVPAGAQP
jgi:hypothetical protein